MSHVNEQSKKVDYKLWIEQPENYPTCLALRPYQGLASRPNLLEKNPLQAISFIRLDFHIVW